MKDSFYKELECVFDKFPKYHTNIWLGNVIAKVGREDTFKSTIQNERLREVSNDEAPIRIVNFATTKNQKSKVQCSHITTFTNTFGHLQVGKFTSRLTTV
jgi:hypothetical protein